MANRRMRALATLAAVTAGPALTLLTQAPAARSITALSGTESGLRQSHTRQPSASRPHWRVFKTLAVKDTTLNPVVALAGRTAWAGGQSSARLPVLYHFAAGRWRLGHMPGQAGTSVQDLAGTSATNVWVTIANADAVAHLTRHGWSTTSFGPTPVSQVCGVVTTGQKSTWVFTSNLASSRRTTRARRNSRPCASTGIGGRSSACPRIWLRAASL